ncbi:thermostable 8-oxoguanine DNA glycosylase [Rhizobium sp. PP-CC-3G-465]|nr:thermostable 8-oxoguanine DNA glycosylase [Rhizobium sp. PP-CC-3G-465]
MQRFWVNIDGIIEEHSLPESRADVMAGVCWGSPDELFTPAFWKYQSEAQVRRNRYRDHRLGETLLEEIAVCLLGGYGIPAEMGMVAFRRLRTEGLLDGEASEHEILERLVVPFEIGGKPRRYRFASQKSNYLSRSLSIAREFSTDVPERQLRQQLLALPGIGPKTASWVVRNHLGSDEVAIIDVHLHRACIIMKVFEPTSNPTRDYFRLEDLFLQFAQAIKVRASVLDALIWDFMRRIGPTARPAKIATRSDQLQLSL